MWVENKLSIRVGLGLMVGSSYMNIFISPLLKGTISNAKHSAGVDITITMCKVC